MNEKLNWAREDLPATSLPPNVDRPIPPNRLILCWLSIPPLNTQAPVGTPSTTSSLLRVPAPATGRSRVGSGHVMRRRLCARTRTGPGRHTGPARARPSRRHPCRQAGRGTQHDYISALVKKCNGILIGLSHVRHQIPSHLLPTLVNALFLSHVRLPGCLWKWVGKNIQRLKKIMNFALRAVSGRRKFDHVSDVREELGWPTARQLYELHSLSFLHKIRCTGEPEALSSQLQVNSVLRSRTTRQDADLALPRVRTEAGRRRLLFNTVQSYNRLPPEIRNLPLGSFKLSNVKCVSF